MDHLAFLAPVFDAPLSERWITMRIEIVQRRDVDAHPINGPDIVSSYETDNAKLVGHSLRDLTIVAQANLHDSDGWYAIGLEYRNATIVTRKRAEAMAKTLKAIETKAEAIRDKQGIDILSATLLAFDKVFPGMTLAETDNGAKVRGFYSDHAWRYTPIGGAVRAINSIARDKLATIREERKAA